MKTALHHQNVSHMAEDVFVIDGVVSTSWEDRKQALNLLMNNRFRIKKILYPQDIQKEMSASCNILVGMKDIVIVANSQTKDKGGRYIPYEYYSASYEDPTSLLESLKRDVMLAGIEVNKADLKAIEWTLNSLQKEKIIISGVLCVCIALPIIIKIFN